MAYGAADERERERGRERERDTERKSFVLAEATGSVSRVSRWTRLETESRTKNRKKEGRKEANRPRQTERDGGAGAKPRGGERSRPLRHGGERGRVGASLPPSFLPSFLPSSTQEGRSERARASECSAQTYSTEHRSVGLRRSAGWTTKTSAAAAAAMAVVVVVRAAASRTCADRSTYPPPPPPPLFGVTATMPSEGGSRALGSSDFFLPSLASTSHVERAVTAAAAVAARRGRIGSLVRSFARSLANLTDVSFHCEEGIGCVRTPLTSSVHLHLRTNCVTSTPIVTPRARPHCCLDPFMLRLRISYISSSCLMDDQRFCSE